MTAKKKDPFAKVGTDIKKPAAIDKAAKVLAEKRTIRISVTLETDQVAKLDYTAKMANVKGRGARDMLLKEAINDLFAKYLAGKGELPIDNLALLKQLLAE